MQGCKDKTRVFYDIPEPETDSVRIVWEKKSNYSIIYPAKATASEKTAASELSKYLKKITGFTIPVFKDTDIADSELEILIGNTNRESSTSDISDLGKEGFFIKFSGKKLVINGGDDRGALYGVYDFLEYLGCGFYAVDTETVPKKATIDVDMNINIREKPIFEYRDLFWSCTYDEVLSAKLRINGCLKSGENGRSISDAYGGGVAYAGSHFVHTFVYFISPDEYFETHPEYFSEIGGERTGKHLYSQLCLTNDDVFNIVVEKVKTWLRDNPKAKIVSVSQNDSFVIDSYCTCSKCKEINDEAGSPAGTLIMFVNKVADAIKDEFPDVAVDTLAYQYSLTPPKNMETRDNVIVRYCTGGCSAHPIDECTSQTGIVSNVKKWAEICKRIYVWDYTTNFREYMCPFPNLDTLQSNIRFFAENNVRGVFEQGIYQEGKNGEFGELRSYLLAKLLWNPDEDVEKLKSDFFKAYYGEGSEKVAEYVSFIHKIVREDGRHFNLVVSCVNLFKGLIKEQRDIPYLDALWTDAKEAAKGDKLALEHIDRSELQYRFYKLNTYSGEFNDVTMYDELVQQFYNDCKKLGVLRLSEGANVPWVE